MTRILVNINPLKSTILLDDLLGGNDMEILRLKVLLDEYRERVGRAQYHLENTDSMTVAASELRYMDEDRMEERANMLADLYREQGRKSHYGDCVAQNTTCAKCTLESYLGINTIEGLTPVAGNVILHLFENEDFGAFTHPNAAKVLDRLNPDNPSEKEAIKYLRKHYMWDDEGFGSW